LRVCKEGRGERWFQEEVGWKLGSGDRVRFWEDMWVGNSTLKTMFPRLYSLSLNQGQKVEEVGVWEDSAWQWTLRWRRARFEWEIPMEIELGRHISSANVLKEEMDTQVWRGDESWCFSVFSAYECLAKYERSPNIDVFKHLWKIKAFPNVVLTAWRVFLGRMPTR